MKEKPVWQLLSWGIFFYRNRKGAVYLMSNNKGLSDKVKGAVSKTKGEVKDQVGNAKNDHRLQEEGKRDKSKGEYQDRKGNLKN